jgi:hypothetical protein
VLHRELGGVWPDSPSAASWVPGPGAVGVAVRQPGVWEAAESKEGLTRHQGGGKLLRGWDFRSLLSILLQWEYGEASNAHTQGSLMRWVSLSCLSSPAEVL